jgi:hypothetical protein
LRFGDEALTIERRGALWTQTHRVSYDDIRAVRVEEQPRSLWERRLSLFSSDAADHRVLLLRAGADPMYVASGLGHRVDAVGWLAARIEGNARSARANRR